jgi:hypothetical protein
MCSALDKASDRKDLYEILTISIFCLAEFEDTVKTRGAIKVIENMKGYISGNVAIKLFSTVLVNRTAKEQQAL